jgi:hypothetical protein
MSPPALGGRVFVSLDGREVEWLSSWAATFAGKRVELKTMKAAV